MDEEQYQDSIVEQYLRNKTNLWNSLSNTVSIINTFIILFGAAFFVYLLGMLF